MTCASSGRAVIAVATSLLPCAFGACRSTAEGVSLSPIALAGTYQIGTNSARVVFDEPHYVAYDGGVLARGTYRIDQATQTVFLTDADTQAEATWSLRAVETKKPGQASLALPASLGSGPTALLNESGVLLAAAATCTSPSSGLAAGSHPCVRLGVTGDAPFLMSGLLEELGSLMNGAAKNVACFIGENPVAVTFVGGASAASVAAAACATVACAGTACLSLSSCPYLVVFSGTAGAAAASDAARRLGDLCRQIDGTVAPIKPYEPSNTTAVTRALALEAITDKATGDMQRCRRDSMPPDYDQCWEMNDACRRSCEGLRAIGFSEQVESCQSACAVLATLLSFGSRF